MMSLAGRTNRATPVILGLLSCAASYPAVAQDAAAQVGPEPAEQVQPAADVENGGEAEADDSGSGSDILSADTLTLLVDVRLALANGANSWIDGGFGKTRFDGTDDGDYEFDAYPVEASLIWQPRFSSSIAGNVSAAYQQGHDRDETFDVMEGYVTFIPPRSGNTNFSVKAGYYWPEISLEHATGGAWSTVYTITPSAINSWVGEEVKVIGAEATLYQTVGSVDMSATAGVFGFNDTSGTLLSFRGWALHDIKSTLFGQFQLPPLNPFMSFAQEPVTRSVLEIDDRPGFYGRFEVRPSSAVVLNAFYYDNRGVPEEFTDSLQWGWRTRFWNFGAVVDLGPSTRLLAQAMTGTTQMGFVPANATRYWVDTRYRSAYALLTHRFGDLAVSGRVELFDTTERGSRMVAAEENEDGWAATIAGRIPVMDRFTLFLEALHVESERGARTTRLGLAAKESQNLVQAALRFRW
ncbi:MAG TPA: hypothetical protein VFS49_06110 [Croceibacterium sp.]|nr:hypothetical protein [Croceibacterium sp.]